MVITDAYAAGLFDGEGWVGILPDNTKRTNKRFEVRIELQMIEPGLAIAPLHHRFGGSLHHFQKRHHQASPTVRWSLSRQDAMTPFLAAIEPYVIVKKQPVQLALGLLRAIASAPRRPNGQTLWTGELFVFARKAREQMNELNVRGGDHAERRTAALGLDVQDFDPIHTQMALLT